MGDFVPSWLVCGGRLFRVCRVSIRSCRSSVPSFIVGFGESWCQCVGVVGLEDVKETMVEDVIVAALVGLSRRQSNGVHGEDFAHLSLDLVRDSLKDKVPETLAMRAEEVKDTLAASMSWLPGYVRGHGYPVIREKLD